MLRFTAVSALCGLMCCTAGCAGSAPAHSGSPATSAGTESAATDHERHEHHEHGGEIGANLAKLSAEDREAAETQHDCPVSGEHLGSMGVPIKIDVNGKPV